MKISKQQILENLDQVKKYISEIESEEIEKGTIYWSINHKNKKYICHWGDDKYDNNLLKNHNVYLNEADCDKQIEKNNALNKIKTYIKDNFGEWTPDWEDNEEGKWSVYYDYEDEEWGAQIHHCCRDLVLIPYLKSKEQAKQLIKDCKEELDVLIK